MEDNGTWRSKNTIKETDTQMDLFYSDVYQMSGEGQLRLPACTDFILAKPFWFPREISFLPSQHKKREKREKEKKQRTHELGLHADESEVSKLHLQAPDAVGQVQ